MHLRAGAVGEDVDVTNTDNGQTTTCLNSISPPFPPASTSCCTPTCSRRSAIWPTRQYPCTSAGRVHSRNDIGALLSEHGLAPGVTSDRTSSSMPTSFARSPAWPTSGRATHVVEIGAGLGSLTMALAETGATITAIEVDHGSPEPCARSWPISRTSRSSKATPCVSIGRQPWRRLTRWVLVANLPYNVATPLVCDLLDFVPAVERMLVMVQREVAERLCASAGSDAYGAVSVKVAYWATARIAGTVPASVFLPRPKVESALAEIRRRATPAVDVAARTAVPSWCELPSGSGGRCCAVRWPPLSSPRCSSCEHRCQRRPEELDVVEWGALTESVVGSRHECPSSNALRPS